MIIKPVVLYPSHIVLVLRSCRLYWQDTIELFNRTNPGGNVTVDSQYKSLLSLMCAWGLIVAAKRFYVGLRLGQKTYQRYAVDLGMS